jgi:hypothetical protein
MANTVEKQVSFRDTFGKISTFSHSEWEIFLRLGKVYILEFEDVLFHHNSAVMMPENPKGKSSQDGTKDDSSDTDDQIIKKDQEQVTGVKALALVFKELELDAEKRLLIAGHTDTSGEIPYNYTLSQLRAQNVYYLLTGERSKWAKVSYEKQKVEDYQQIMKHYAGTFNCDPGDVDNKWGTKTKTATENFIKNYNKDFVPTVPGVVPLSEDLVAKVEGNGKKLWPHQLWEAVYNLYSNGIRDILDDKWVEFNTRRDVVRPDIGKKHPGSFMYAERRYVGCGESFPIDDSEKDKYRSQENRRVEIMFFDRTETKALPIEAFHPCEETDRKHKDTECPLWHNRRKEIHYKQLYIDPNDLYAFVYHIKFKYFDRIAEELRDVPAGLTITAYEQHSSRGTKKLHTVSKYKNGVYSVKVQYKPPLDDPDRIRVYFEIETMNMWIYTKEKTAKKSEIKIITQKEINALPQSERFKYYDIPEKWSSKEALARYEGSAGGKVENADIMDAKDKIGWFNHMFRKIGGPSPHYKPFGDKRTTPDKPLVFCLDDMVPTGNDFKPHENKGITGALLDNTFNVINPDKSNHKSYYTKGNLFEGKVIPFRYGFARGVILKDKNEKNSQLYTIHNDRVEKNDALAGHRAVVYEHAEKCIHIPKFIQYHYRWYHEMGNFHAYLVRETEYDYTEGEIISYIFIHQRWHYKAVSADANVTPQWIDKDAIPDIVNEWNDKANNKLVSLFHEDTSAHIKQRINIKYHIEHVDTEGDQRQIIYVHPADEPGRSKMGRTNGHIRMHQVKKVAGKKFSGAHEFGHGTSIDDDYCERFKYCNYRQPGFVDFKEAVPFHRDIKSMMRGAIEIRSRHYWHFAEWMNKEFVPGQITQFIVKKTNEEDYELPPKSRTPWNTGDPRDIGNHYYNYPDPDLKFSRTFNSKNNLGLFGTYLYPLGKDPYSQGKNGDGTRYGDALKPGKAFTALIVIKVNLYFEFKYSPSYKDIYKFLEEVNEGINDNFVEDNNIKICGSNPYEDTFVLFQPRFLVHNYAAGYNKLNDKLTNKAKYNNYRAKILRQPESKTYWKINVTDPTFGTLFSNTSWDRRPNTLNFIKGDADEFWEYFSQMLGLKLGELPTKDNFAVNHVLNGDVKNV